MLPKISLLAFAIARLQTALAFPGTETPTSVADIRLAINGVIQDREKV